MSKIYGDIQKSTDDQLKYRGLILSNEMRVMLVNDSKAQKASAAISVKVGHNDDPVYLSGLASLCGHMIFMGCKKYPGPDTYANYMVRNCGFTDMMTQPSETKFILETDPSSFEEALDIFAHSFISPLFAREKLQTIIDSLELEYQKLVLSDTWRDEHINSFLCNTQQENIKISCGSKYTLHDLPVSKGVDVYKELLNFHRKYYSSNLMSLVLYGSKPLDELEIIAQELFDSVENKNIILSPNPDFSNINIPSSSVTYVAPIHERSTLRMYFSIPNLITYSETFPYFYLSYLLKNEGKASLLSFFKSRGWMASFDIKIIQEYGKSHMVLHMDLSSAGLENTQIIISSIFIYIKFLINEGPQKWIFDECCKILYINYRLNETQPSTYYILNIASNLLYYPINEVIIAPFLISEYNSNTLNLALQALKPENARIFIIDRRYKEQCDSIEPIVGIEYRTQNLTEVQIKKLEVCPICFDFKLPEPNELIPEDLDILPALYTTPYPVLIYDNEKMRMWFKQDSEYKSPCVFIKIMIAMPRAYLDPLSCNLTEIFVDLVQQVLTNKMYNASILAGLSWHLSNSKQGFAIHIEGASSKIHILLSNILNEVTKVEIDDQLFEKIKANYESILENLGKEQSYVQALYYMYALLSEREWAKDALLDSCKYTTAQNLRNFLPILFSYIHVESLIFGNYSNEQALNICQIIEKCMNLKKIAPLFPQQLNNFREYKLEPQSQYLFNISSPYISISCTNVLYQCGLQETSNKILLDLLLEILQKPCHETLKIKEGLGSFIFCVARRTTDVQGLRIIVQSELPPLYIDYRIEKFIDDMKSHLMTMTNDELESYKKLIIEKRLEKPKSISDAADKYWEEIESQKYNFTRSNTEIALLKNITMQQVLSFFLDYIEISGKNRSKLAVYVTPMSSNKSEESKLCLEAPLKYFVIENIESFQRTKGLFSLIDNSHVPRKGLTPL